MQGPPDRDTIPGMRSSIRRVAGHEVVEVAMTRPYRPYDRLVFRDPRTGRSLWTVLACDRQEEGWQVTGLRCPPGYPLHRRRR
jgi:hypothetical protein